MENECLLVGVGPQGKTPSLANLFRDNGYNTAMLGKQHSNMELFETLPNGTFIIIGCAEAPWNGGITFENVVIGGKKLTSLKDFDVNEYVTDITFQ